MGIVTGIPGSKEQMKQLSIKYKSLIVIFLILVTDQASKIWVKTNMVLGQEIPIIGNSVLIHFTENYGMAFGYEFGGEYGKIALSLFRIVAVAGIIWYIGQLINRNAPQGLVLSISLILAGAVGNIIDSAFYGMIFSDSYFTPAEFLPQDGGYATFLHGRVVDMFYFPVLRGNWPDWFPVIGGQRFIFFRPVFNIADTAITTGVAVTLVFYRKYFN
jgi:signal peptidase II